MQAFEGMGELFAALKDYERAVDLDSDDPTAKEGLEEIKKKVNGLTNDSKPEVTILFNKPIASERNTRNTPSDAERFLLFQAEIVAQAEDIKVYTT